MIYLYIYLFYLGRGVVVGRHGAARLETPRLASSSSSSGALVVYVCWVAGSIRSINLLEWRTTARGRPTYVLPLLLDA